MADRPQDVRIVSAPGGSTVTVGGTDITNLLQGYTLEHRMNQTPLLVLYTVPRDGVVLDGLAHIVVGEDRDPGPLIASFLSNISPQALEEAALNRDDLADGRYAVTSAALA
jgi:hypothetical protein